MMVVYAALISFVLDLLFADPEWIPHPVVLMGKVIDAFEKKARKGTETPKRMRRCGRVLAVLLPSGTFLAASGLLVLFYLLHPAAAFALNVFWGWQTLAVRGLQKESVNVYRKLTGGTLEEAQKAVSRIVGRDTSVLDRTGSIKAAVETVAENFSDGVIAPMLYLLIGGAPLALAYKAINTMDSMIGYKNERYLDFGRCAARLDDAANFIPARLSALLLIAAAALTGQNAKRAAGIWKRDRRKHESPNSAQTESVMAGALGIRLAGPAVYFGAYHEKPYLGDALRKPEEADIRRANRMMVTGSFLAMILLCGLRAGIFLFL